MIPDAELLQRFRDDPHGDALGQLVGRYVDLVYSAALRQLRGDARAAEDVSQQVFADFARKAPALTQHTALSGWFYTSTHFAAAKLMRTEARRRARETEAHAMNQIHAAEGDAGWNQLQPVLDDVMHQLNDRDRTLVLLRYFEKRPLAEIGAELGLSENAAAKAMERTLDKLRDLFARRGVSSTSGALALALAHHAVTAAPPALASGITASLLAPGALAAGTVAFFSMSKTTSVLVVALLVSLAGFAIFQTAAGNQARSDRRALRTEIARLNTDAQRDAAALRAAHEELARLRAAQTETAQLRTEVAALQTAAAVPKAPPTRLLTSFANVGRATPAAALQTMIWAMEHGQVKAAHDIVVYDEGATGVFQQIFDTLSERARAYIGTPGVMAIAAGASAPGGPPPRVEIVEETLQGPDEVALRFQWNDEPRPRPLTFRRFADGWKAVATSRPFMKDPAIQAEIKRRIEDLAAKAPH